MRLFKALKVRKYFLVAVLSILVIGLFLPLVQTGFDYNNILAWYLALVERPYNTVLYISFSILFGMLVSLQLYNKEICKTCNVKMENKKGTSVGAAGSILGFAIGVCPACIGLIGLFVPLTISITLTNYSWMFLMVAIIILLFAIYKMGGFKYE